MPLHLTDNLNNLTSPSVARTNLKVPASDATAISGANVINNIVSISQADYDAIALKDASTLYVIAP